MSAPKGLAFDGQNDEVGIVFFPIDFITRRFPLCFSEENRHVFKGSVAVSL